MIFLKDLIGQGWAQAPLPPEFILLLFCVACLWRQSFCDVSLCLCSYGPRREKTCLRGFQQSDNQTSLLSYRAKLEN